MKINDMTIKKNRILYLMYCVMVLASFLQGVDVFPPIVKFLSNKIFYISVIVCLLLSSNSKKITILRNVRLPAQLLIFFALFYIISNYYHREPGWLESSIGNGVFYLLTFLAVHAVSRVIFVEKLLAPYLIIVSVLVALSLAMVAGLPLDYYNIDDDVNDYYLASKSSLSLAVLSGVYYNQNSFAVLAFMGACVFLMKYQLLQQSKEIIKYYHVAMLIIVLVCALMTVSRAGLLACTILILFYMIKSLKNKKILLILLLLNASLLVVFYFFYEHLNFLMLRIENDGSSNRVDIWIDAFNVFKDNYILGAGYYMYYTPSGYVTTHNVYLQLLVSQGIFAFLFWTLFLSNFVFFAIKNVALTKIRNNPVAVIASICFLAILVHQFFETMIIGSWGPLVLFMFVLMNLIVNVGLNDESNAVRV